MFLLAVVYSEGDEVYESIFCALSTVDVGCDPLKSGKKRLGGQ